MCNTTTTSSRSAPILSIMATIVLVLATTSAHANLIAYYPFDTDFADASGNKNDLTIATGTPTITSTAGEYVFGGGALDADSTVSTEEYLNLTSPITFGDAEPWSIAFWARRRPGTDMRTGMVIGDTSNTTDFIWVPDNPSQVRGLRFRSSANTNANFDGFPDDNQFHHWVVVADGAGNVSAYRDNVLLGSVAMTSSFSITSVAGAYSATTQSMDGQIDELCIYDEAIDAATVDNLYNGQGPLEMAKASYPWPNNDATDVSSDVVLSWKPGDFAATHDVYFGTSFDDVNDAGRTDPRAVLVSQDQTAATYEPPTLLDFAQTYYWRIDEVNGAPDYTIFKGRVWNFTVEPLAYPIEGVIATSDLVTLEDQGPENTVNGSGLNANDEHSTDTKEMWTATIDPNEPDLIQFEFDRVYKMHEMRVWNHNLAFEAFLGLGVKDVTIEYSTDGLDWMVLGDVELPQAPGTPYTGTPVPLEGVAARYVRLVIKSAWTSTNQVGLSEVRFTYIPAHAREPEPQDGATGVSPDTVLGWRAGRDSVSHEIYIGADPNALNLIATTDVASYAADLDLGATYYWSVDELAADDGTWPGEVWTFSMQETLSIDGFETYDDDVEAGTTIWQTWLDGLVDTKYGGSQVGYDVADNGTFGETTLVKTGSQSMPVQFDNTSAPFYSEVELPFASPQNWTVYGVKTLTLWFHGDAANTDAQMYVKINGSRIDYDGEAENLQRKPWQLWRIDLGEMTGVDLSSVTDLTIGLEGGAGILFIDDIALSPAERELITPVEPDSGNLLAQYAFEGDAGNATVIGAPTYVDGHLGQAIVLNGAGDHLWSEGSFDLPTYTATAWFRVDGGEGERDVVALYDSNGAFGILLEVRSNGQLRYLHRAPLGTSNQTDLYSGGGDTYDDGIWYHAAMVKTVDTTTLYINGVAVVSGASEDEFGGPLHNLALGVLRHDNLQRFFPGAIDEVRLYGRALSAGEAAWLAGRTDPFDKE